MRRNRFSLSATLLRGGEGRGEVALLFPFIPLPSQAFASLSVLPAMCTVSIVARRSGYLLAMNRDEQRTRARALPPKHFLSHGRSVISPSEPGGGTWISLNDARVTFALINWYSIKARVTGLPRSRGEIVNAVNSRTSPDEAAQILGQLPLKRINPFRLIGVFPATKQIVEWRWDLKTLSRKNHSWTTRQFISSGFDEPRAQRVRGKTFRHALRAKTSGTLDWLRRLHRSHAPETGPFSTCMHRADAQTVSCTEILVSASRAQMRYYDGPPCEAAISEPLMQTNPRRLKIRKVACNSAQ